jgi:glucose/mannose-6-phosphate isomerase
MRDIIRALPAQIQYAVDHTSLGKRRAKKQHEKVLVCGMGGSGISGNLLQTLYPSIDVMVNKDYSIPGHVDHRTLAVIISYSGNTEETLSNFRQLTQRKIERVVISSDGKLIKKAAGATITVPAGLPPRGALGHLFTPLPFVLYHYRMIKKNPQKEFSILAGFLKKKTDAIEARAKKLATEFIGKLPIIYAPSPLYHVIAQRWQCQFNENAKTLAHINIIPEMNHNEIVGLGNPVMMNPHTVLVFLHDPGAHPRNKRRAKVVKQIVKNTFPSIIDINALGANAIQRAFWTIMLGDLISYHLAVMTGVDPMPVVRIDYLKKQLSKK